MTTPPRVIAEFTDYHGMLRGLRERARQRQIATTSETTSKLSGLPDKYMQKLIGIKPVRRLGMMSLGAVAGTLAVKFLMVEDAEAMARLERQSLLMFDVPLKPRKEYLVRKLAVLRQNGKHARRPNPVALSFLRKIAPTGGARRALKLSPSKRRKIARAGARARWGGRRKRRKLGRN